MVLELVCAGMRRIFAKVFLYNVRKLDAADLRILWGYYGEKIKNIIDCSGYSAAGGSSGRTAYP